MKYRAWGVLLILVMAWTCQAHAQESSGQRLNVLFLISDDLNNYLGCYGDPRAKTPNLDRLAERSVLFDRAYCTYPLCGPSRNSMLCGLYPNSTGIHHNTQIFRQSIPDHKSLPQSFRLSGYFAGRIGKLYHYGVPRSVGTNGNDDPASWELELNPAGVDRLEEQPEIVTLVPGQFGGTLSWLASSNPEEKHTDAMMASDAEWVLDRCARESRPFFLAVGFFRPHTPYVAPKSYFENYPADEMPVVTGIEEDQADMPAPAYASSRKVEREMSEQTRRDCVQAYYASISFMDAQVGKVVDALDRNGLAENTVIVFTSDHGYHMGEHGLWQKMTMFEEATRVPLMISAPGARNGEVVKAPVSQVDLYPTLCELCGVEAPENLQGQSLVPMLKNPDEPGRGWALSQVERGGRDDRFFGYSLRTPDWRYTEWDGGERGRELYDHNNDPHEMTNVVDSPENASLVSDLSEQLKQAIQSSYPESGMSPEVKGSEWLPLLVKP